MTIEIIKRGKAPPPQEYRATCPNCDTKLKFNRTDAVAVYNPRDGSDYLVLECPVCHEEVTAAD